VTQQQHQRATAIRLAIPGDAANIATISIDAWRHNYRGLIDDATLDGLQFAKRLAEWQQRLDQGVLTLVAERDGKMLGWLGIDHFQHPDGTRLEVVSLTHGWGEIKGFYIAPQAQRQGVGTALWHAARRLFLERNYRHVGLWVLAENWPAIRFYEACGLREESLYQSFEIQGQPLVESLMSRRL
jgi:ribosomal protein S18 acetylase RimI-like enzyme